MVNYNNTKIYKIESHLGDKIYIGSTTKKLLSQRMANHRSDFIKWKNGEKKYKCSSIILFNEYGLENCKIVLLENYSCNTKDELLSKEAFYIKSIKCVNKIIPKRTRIEYKQDNNNYDKNYYEQNKFIIKESQKKYYNENKDIILQKNKIKNECLCGCIINYRNLLRHQKTKKHINKIKISKDFSLLVA
jgi:hypothetical protein